MPIINWCISGNITNITLVSDSTVAQYRNMKNVYVKSLAMEHGLTCEWLYTETEHRKSICDSIGGNLKTKIGGCYCIQHQYCHHQP